MFCPKCGTQLPDGAQFCSNCGNQLGNAAINQAPVSNNSAPKNSNKTLIIILSICLGVLILLGGGLVAYGAATGIFFGSGSGEAGTSASEQQNNEQDWEAAKAAYLRKVSSYQFPSKCKFIFIDINGDNIQELYMQGPDYATGDMLWTYYNGNVSELRVPNYGLSYFEGKNYFMSQQMHMGVGWDNVFSIEDGEFVSHHYGEWTDGSAYPGKADKYVLDGEAMDKSTYELELKHLYDIDGAKKLDSKDPGWMTLAQLMSQLNQPTGSHFYECEYFYFDILDTSKLPNMKVVKEYDSNANGYEWSISWLPNVPNSGGGILIMVSDRQLSASSSSYTYYGTTSSGKYVYYTEGGGGLISGSNPIGKLTLK